MVMPGLCYVILAEAGIHTNASLILFDLGKDVGG